MKDAILVGLVVITFAWMLTTHLAIVYGLAKRAPRFRALVALVVPPLAPYWAWQGGMRARTGLWIAGTLGYLVTRILASF